MNNINIKKMNIAGIALFFMVNLITVSCKKQINETDSLSDTDVSTNITSEIISTQLNRFWNCYSTFKEVSNIDSSISNLNGLVNEQEMLSTLHYSLNTALTEVDTTYEIVTTAEFYNDIELTNEDRFTYKNLCRFFDKTLMSIKEYTLSTEITEKKIHEIFIEVNSYNQTTVTLKTKVKFSSGELYATSDLGWTSEQSPYLAKFNSNYQIPWVAKTSPEQGKNPTGFSKYSYFNFALNRNWNVTPSSANLIQTKLSADKAAHDILSNNALFWLNPSTQNNAIGSTLAKVVPSLERIGQTNTFVRLVNQEATMNNPSDNITPLDVAVNCGNPSKPNLINGNEAALDIQPSALLSYYNTENFYNLTDFRKVSGPQMNFFWRNRGRIVSVAFNKKASEINNKMSSLFSNNGFYALSEINYVVQVWQSRNEINNCFVISCSPNQNWNICKFICNYRPDIILKHYSYQPVPPSYWRNLQNSVL